MIQSFFTASTGLNAYKKWLSILSGDIANVNTIGYKGERLNFKDLITSSITSFANDSPTNLEIGGGAFAASTIKDFSQGALMNTNSSTDLALDGEGFFMVQDNQGTTYYTRAGQFRTDADGYLINPNGMYLKGWALDEAGNISGAIGPINIPSDMSPKVTSNLALKSPTNLDATSSLIRNIFNTNDSTTYSYVNSVNVYDSIGVSHEVKYYFIHEDANSWKVFGVLDDEPIKFTDENGNQYAFLRLEFNGTGQVSKISLEGKVNSLTTPESTSETIDNGTFYLNYAASLPGSIVISSYNDGTNTYNVRWIDDGNGNIVDLDNNNQIIGSIDYDTGKILINSFVGNGTTETLTVDYNYYSERINNGASPANTPVLENTIYIRKYFDGTNWNIVNWADDGNGNIIDLDNNNNVVGTINYSTGAITITVAPVGSQIDVVYEFNNANSIQANKITMAAIPTTNNYSQTLNTGGNPIQYTLNLNELKQLKSDFIFYAKQDGYGKGDLLSISISEDGIIKGVYSNGQVRDWARIAIATFRDKEVLVSKGNNLFLPNSQTFTPIIVPGGVISKIKSGFLELSNVDISRGFIDLITTQRAYQANARAITTSDQLLRETMDLKR